MTVGVIGAVFTDTVGRPTGSYFDPTGRNVGSIDICCGGVGKNIAHTLNCYGSRTRFLTTVSDDIFGQTALEELKSSGIDTSCIREGKNGSGTWLAVMNAQGDLCASISRQPDFSLLEECLSEFGRDFIESCDFIALECDLTGAILENACRLCTETNTPLFGAVSNMEVLLRHRHCLLAMDAFVCNKTEAGRLLDKEVQSLDARSLIELVRTNKEIFPSPLTVITLGNDGAIWVDRQDDSFGHAPTLAVDIKDTTGAGDSFFAGFVYAKSCGRDTKAAVTEGLKAAARTISYIGPAAPAEMF